MNIADLLKLGFKDTSYVEDFQGHEECIYYQEYTLETENFIIQITGACEIVEIKINNNWIDVPNCKTTNQLKQLIKLFS